MLAFHVNIYSMCMLTGIRRSNKKLQKLTFNSIINLLNILLFLDNSRSNYARVRIKRRVSITVEKRRRRRKYTRKLLTSQGIFIDHNSMLFR